MSTLLPPRLDEFLTSLLPAPSLDAELQNYVQHGSKQIEAILRQAAITGVLSDRVRLVDYAHVRPEDLKLNILAPILVHQDHAIPLLWASAHLLKYIGEQQLSFFKKMSAYIQDNDRVDTCTIVFSRGKASMDHEGSDLSHVVLSENYELPEYSDLNIDKEIVEGTNWLIVRRKNVALPDSMYPSVDIVHVDSWVEEMLGSRLGEYLRRMALFTAYGDVVILVPGLFSPDHTPERTITSGGCLFVVEPGSARTLLPLLRIVAHKICVTASGSLDVVRLAGARTSARQTKQVGDVLSQAIEHEHTNLNARIRAIHRRARRSRDGINDVIYREIEGWLDLTSHAAQGLRSVFVHEDPVRLDTLFEAIDKSACAIGSSINVTVDTVRSSCLDTLYVLPSIRLVIVELVRNAIDYVYDCIESPKSKNIGIHVEDIGNKLVISVINPIMPEDIENVGVWNSAQPSSLFASSNSQEGALGVRKGILICKYLLHRLEGSLTYSVQGDQLVAAVTLPKQAKHS